MPNNDSALTLKGSSVDNSGPRFSFLSKVVGQISGCHKRATGNLPCISLGPKRFFEFFSFSKVVDASATRRVGTYSVVKQNKKEKEKKKLIQPSFFSLSGSISLR